MKLTIKEKFILFFVALAFVFAIVFFNLFENFSNNFYDNFLTRQLKNKAATSDIVLITVDKNTVKRYGNESFWTRARYTSLINKLEKEDPKVIYFDYYFSEKTNPENVDWDLLQDTTKLSADVIDNYAMDYNKAIKSPEYFSSIDTSFLRTLKRHNNIVFPKLYRVNDSGITNNVQIAPLPIFGKYSRVGYSNVMPDSDGVIRSLKIANNDKPVAQLIAELFLGNGNDIYLGNKVNFSKYLFDNGRLLINYYSVPYDQFVSIPFQNAYNSIFFDYKGNKINLKNKVIIIGDYDESFGDMHKTPVGNGKLMSGMEIIANQVQTLINTDYILKINGAQYYLFMLLFLILFFLLFIVIDSYIISTSLFLLLIIFTLYLDYGLLNINIYFDYVGIFLALFFPFIVIIIFRLYIDNREKVNTRRFFSKYVEQGIVDELIKSRKLPALHGIKKDITTLFTDIEGFTTITEKLEPEEIISLLNNIFNRCNKIIFKNSGTLDKYIGDAIMAFWGAPKDLEMSPILACKTAIEMQDEIVLFNSWNINPKIPKLNFRFGISTGEVTVGSIGNDQYSDYTVIGDRVNLASRLEGINKYYDTNIVICEETYKLVKDKFYTREIDIIKVKGKNEPIRIYELLAMRGEINRNISNIKDLIFNQEVGLKYYRQMKWKEALEYFHLNSTKFDDKLAEVFIKRIELLKLEKIPNNLDGVFVFDVK